MSMFIHRWLLPVQPLTVYPVYGAATVGQSLSLTGAGSWPMTDDEAIGAVVDEMYAMISGPKGPRDWSRQKNCFVDEARQARTWVDEAGQPGMTLLGLDDYARDTTPFFAANDFYEVETSRRIDRLGNMAHVWSGYEARRSPDDSDVERRGINSIQLFRHPQRGWRIVHMIWDNERD